VLPKSVSLLLLTIYKKKIINNKKRFLFSWTRQLMLGAATRLSGAAAVLRCRPLLFASAVRAHLPAAREPALVGLRGLCAMAPPVTVPTPAPTRVDLLSAEERVWILGKTWSVEKGRFITAPELKKRLESTRAQRKLWARLAKCKARRKRRRAKKEMGRYYH